MAESTVPRADRPAAPPPAPPAGADAPVPPPVYTDPPPRREGVVSDPDLVLPATSH
jgi:hypothetical protein